MVFTSLDIIVGVVIAISTVIAYVVIMNKRG